MTKQRFNRVAADPSQLQKFVDEMIENGGSEIYELTAEPSREEILEIINSKPNGLKLGNEDLTYYFMKINEGEDYVNYATIMEMKGTKVILILNPKIDSETEEPTLDTDVIPLSGETPTPTEDVLEISVPRNDSPDASQCEEIYTKKPQIIHIISTGEDDLDYFYYKQYFLPVSSSLSYTCVDPYSRLLRQLTFNYNNSEYECKEVDYDLTVHIPGE